MDAPLPPYIVLPLISVDPEPSGQTEGRTGPNGAQPEIKIKSYLRGVPLLDIGIALQKGRKDNRSVLPSHAHGVA